MTIKAFILKIILFCFMLRPSIGFKIPQPHIIFIYVDDWGWNDNSFHGSPEIPTPNIDAMAMSGILLNNYYGYWLCTPSRSALMSGINPIRLGLQHDVIRAGERSALPIDVVTLPQHLKSLGYSTHAIGKWHLGYMTKKYTPTYRGFDSFFGYYNGLIDYYDYTFNDLSPVGNIPPFWGIDLHNGTTTVRNRRGQYATELFTNKATDIIAQHDASKPLFMYLSHLAVHSGNKYHPQQAPPRYVNRVKHIADIKRRTHAGAVVALDDSVGNIFKALDDKGMLDNSIIFLVSDNGGEFGSFFDSVGSNYPLRGQKYTMWEGGSRVPAMVWSPLLQLRRPRISMQMMHVTDWLPTIYGAAGGDPNNLQGVDGIDMWKTLKFNTQSRRDEILYNIDPTLHLSALRKGDLKVINGSRGDDGWYNPSNTDCFGIDKQSALCTFHENGLVQDVLKKSNRWIVEDVADWRRSAMVRCPQPPPASNCNPLQRPCLFNVTSDPCEYYNLADIYPQAVDYLMGRIHAYEATAAPPQSKPGDPLANPECHGFAHVPWLDPEFYNDCTAYS